MWRAEAGKATTDVPGSRHSLESQAWGGVYGFWSWTAASHSSSVGSVGRNGQGAGES